MDVTGSFKKPALSSSVSKDIIGQLSWHNHQSSPRILFTCQSLRHYCCEHRQQCCWVKSKWEETGNWEKQVTWKHGSTCAQTQKTDQRQSRWSVPVSQDLQDVTPNLQNGVLSTESYQLSLRIFKMWHLTFKTVSYQLSLTGELCT